MASWLTIQLGAREHYAIPRALHQRDLLAGLITDFWQPPGSSLVALPALQRVRDRWHPQLSNARIWANSPKHLLAETWLAACGKRQGWPGIISRNQGFQRSAAARLRRLRNQLPQHTVVMAYSYAARLPLAVARAQGWRTVLGQIDPGPEEERIVAAERRRYPDLATSWEPAPASYWQQWHLEVEEADRVLVNSHWSLQCLIKAGIPTRKLSTVPLVYEAALPPQPSPVARAANAPFQLLFLGTIGLRKGIARLLEAMRILESEPVQLTLAGPSELDPQAWAPAPNIRWLGPVPRSQVGQLYQQAHAMILPTLSDGFALTQLEALAHGCPVIASTFCGEVVSPGVNGWLLPSLEPESIAATIREAMATAQALPRPLQRPHFGLSDLADAMQQFSLPTVSP